MHVSTSDYQSPYGPQVHRQAQGGIIKEFAKSTTWSARSLDLLQKGCIERLARDHKSHRVQHMKCGVLGRSQSASGMRYTWMIPPGPVTCTWSRYLAQCIPYLDKDL